MSKGPEIEGGQVAIAIAQFFSSVLGKLDSIENRITALEGRINDTPTKDPDEFLTIDQVHQEFGKSKSTLYFWRKKYGIGKKAGREITFRRSEIENFIANPRKR